MKKNNRDSATAVASDMSENQKSKRNGNSVLVADPASADLSVILASLQTMRDGDFSVRLPGSWTGLAGKIADTFNSIVSANQQMAEELRRVGQVIGKEGRTRERTRFHESRGAWGDMEVTINTLVEDLLRPTAGVTRAIAAVCSSARQIYPTGLFSRIATKTASRFFHSSARVNGSRGYFTSTERGKRTSRKFAVI